MNNMIKRNIKKKLILDHSIYQVIEVQKILIKSIID